MGPLCSRCAIGLIFGRIQFITKPLTLQRPHYFYSNLEKLNTIAHVKYTVLFFSSLLYILKCTIHPYSTHTLAHAHAHTLAHTFQ